MEENINFIEYNGNILKEKVKESIQVSIDNLSNEYTNSYKGRWLITKKRNSKWKCLGKITDVKVELYTGYRNDNILTRTIFTYENFKNQLCSFNLTEEGITQVRISDGDLEQVKLLIEIDEL